MSSAPPRNRRGFATMMAIILIGMVGATLAVMTALFAHEARRTRQTRCEAQLRQMLLAGAASVEERRAAWPADVAEQRWTVPLPKGLAEDGAIVSVHATPRAPVLEAVVEGKLDGRSAKQTLTIVRTGGHWQIAKAKLGD